MEIPNNHLAQIFAKHFGQEVAIVSSPKNELQKQKVSCSNLAIIEHLELRPLLAITDEHAIEVANMSERLHKDERLKVINIVRKNDNVKVYFHSTWNEHDQFEYFVKVAPFPLQGIFKTYKGEILEQFNYQFPLHAYQYLHALGYALPITLLDENNKPVTYSVDDLINSGVYKLI